jgi:hypothetical protein
MRIRQQGGKKENEPNTEIQSTKEDEKVPVSHSGNIAKINPKTQEILKESYNFSLEEVTHAIASGFDIATYAGPLCEEPMIGILKNAFL